MKPKRIHFLLLLLCAVPLAAPVAAEEAMGPIVIVSALDELEAWPQAVYNPLRDEYLVAWVSVDWAATPEYRVLARRFDRYSRPRGGSVLLSPPADGIDRFQAALAYDRLADRYLVVYTFGDASGAGDLDVRGRFVSWNLQNLGPELLIAASGDRELRPRVEFSYVSENFLVIWNRKPWSGYEYVRGALMTETSIDEFAIAGDPAEFRCCPDLAYQPAGDSFLVASRKDWDLFGTRVDGAGGVGPEVPIIESWPDHVSTPSVASCQNDQYAVAWSATEQSSTDSVHLRFLDGDGNLASPPLLLESDQGTNPYPDVGCLEGGGEYLAVWTSGFLPSGVRGRRIGASGALRPAFELRPAFPGETVGALTVSTAGGATGWLTVWSSRRQGTSYNDIHARVTWALFSDGFEWGDTNQWSSVVP